MSYVYLRGRVRTDVNRSSQLEVLKGLERAFCVILAQKTELNYLTL